MTRRSFLGYVDLLGTTYTASTLATGYGSMIAQPLLRQAVEGRERTLDELLQVTARAGWKILAVRRVRDDLRFGHVVSAPI